MSDRLPVLSFYDSQSGASIWRCSQPKSELFKKKSHDKDLLVSIGKCNAQYAGQPKTVVIFDARPQINARANMLKGGGYETCDSKNYTNCQIKFCRIPNIHEVRSSTRKMFQLAYCDSHDSAKAWYQAVD